MTLDTASLPLTRWQRFGVAALVGFFLLFGTVVELRSAFLQRRMGDVGVYFRAGWAVRAGVDPYSVTDDNRWHYVYPPVFALFMTPLADPPPGAEQAGMCPYALGVAVWYLFSVGCLAAGTHWLASAIEETTVRPPTWSRRWWFLRALPVAVCLPAIARTLVRGQVNLLVLFLLCGMTASLLRQQRFRAGLLLAGAICIKLFPAFLLLYPLWRRDGRCLLGCAAGLIVGVVVLPSLAFGPTRAFELHRTFAEVLIKPALGAGTDRSRAEELTDVTSTDTQSLLAVLHNTVHLDRDTRPHQAEPWERQLALVLGALMTGAVLLAAGFRQSNTGPAEIVVLGALTLVMVLLSPVCHFHYFAFVLPLVMGLVALRWEQTDTFRVGAVLTAVLFAQVLGNVVTALPGETVDLMRDVGVTMYVELLLWLAGLVALVQQRRVIHEVRKEPTPAARAA